MYGVEILTSSPRGYAADTRATSETSVDCLISFCGARTAGLPPVGVYSIKTGAFYQPRWPSHLRHAGLRGLAITGSSLVASVAVDRHSTPVLLMLDRETLAPTLVHRLASGRDLHSLTWTSHRLLAVSTGTDEVVELIIDRRGKPLAQRSFWRVTSRGQPSDTVHLNGICGRDGELFVSAFGRRQADSWSTAADGFIVSLRSNRVVMTGLTHPHSVIVGPSGDLLFCESRRRIVRSERAVLSPRLPGYVRGLCRAGRSLIVGTSIGRSSPADADGEISNPGDAGIPRGRCMIVTIDFHTQMVTALRDLSAHFSEIYDVIALPRSYASDKSLLRRL